MEFKSLGETPVNNVLKGKSHGWIQFKGTNLCMDLRCDCGQLSHIDGDFLYFMKCGYCGKTYELNGRIELIERIETEIDRDIRVTETD